MGAAAVSPQAPRTPHSSLLSPWADLGFDRLANVAGTQEPVYGPEAIKSVATEAETTPYTELTKEDAKWEVMESTCVETQTFYFMADNGQLAFAQVIYSNVAWVPVSADSAIPSLTVLQRHPDYLPVQLQDLQPRRLGTPPLVLDTAEQLRLQRRQDRLLCR